MRLWTDLWNLLFPRCCLVCGRILTPGEESVCLSCLHGLPRTHDHLLENSRVESYFLGRFPLGRATSFCPYVKDDDVGQVIYGLKYYGCKEVGIVMGRTMATELHPSGFFEGIDLIIPVPLHKSKKQKRGYNQSEYLAQGIAKVTRLPVCADAIVKLKATESQTHKNREERWANVQNLFACTSPHLLEGKHVLLVDDVLTTGATLTACADALKDIPGICISVLTWAIAVEP